MKHLEEREMNYSVLMSVYAKDNPEHLILAIESMLNQTVKPEQFVIVQDGPLPEKLELVISNYAEQESQLFTIVPLAENGGLGNALNAGLLHCRNDLVARMDADDISLPQRCEKELALFAANEELAICGCNIDEFYDTPDDIRTSRVVPCKYKDILRFSRRRQPFNHPTVIYKKSKVIEVGGYPSIRRKEDFDLFSRMLIRGNYALNINESLYLYRANENNYKRRKSWQNTKSAIRVYGLHYKRKGCRLNDYLVSCVAELLLSMMPLEMMRKISDKVLRVRVNEASRWERK